MTSLAGGISIALALMLRFAWSGWKNHRNSLPDDERAAIYWNDERYERLLWWMTASLWTLAGVLAVGVAIFAFLLHSEGKL